LAALRGDAAQALALLWADARDAWVDCHLTELLFRAGALPSAELAGLDARQAALARFAAAVCLGGGQGRYWPDACALAKVYLEALPERQARAWLRALVDRADPPTDLLARRLAGQCADWGLPLEARAVAVRRARFWRVGFVVAGGRWGGAAWNEKG
jgi:hypothetical protein